MGRDRVIQDSDDEDDPLCVATTSMGPPPKNLRGQDASTRTQHDLDQVTCLDSGTANDDTQDAVVDNDSRVSGSQLGVNLDDSLQSPEGEQAQLPFSQPRLETKWIPGINSGISRLGSIGVVMTEIDLAQKRLLDDEASYNNDGQQSYPGSIQGEQHQYVTPYTYKQESHQDEAHRSNNSVERGLEQPAPNQNFLGEQQNEMPEYGLIHRGTDDDGGYCYENDEIVPDHASDQSPAVYNYFESSLEKGSGDYSNAENDAPISRPYENDQINELHRTPFRSKSLQATSYSPHDTEPTSSLVLSNLNRAKSDNATGPAWQQEEDQPLSQKSMHDELSAPVSIEIPIVKKTIGRKEKQDVIIDEEDDELALPYTNEKPREAREQTEKNSAEAADDTEARDAVIPENEMLQETNLNSPEEAPAKFPEMPPPAIPEVRFARPAKPEAKTKEPKKKKLKRGKTTSVTLRKTYEPGVEDDVIWIDERHTHSLNTTQNKWNLDDDSFLSKPSKSIVSSATSQAEPGPGSSEAKKRGSKRKKTSEQQLQSRPSVADSPFLPIQYGQEDVDNHTQVENTEPPFYNVHYQDKNTSNNIHKIHDDSSHGRDQEGAADHEMYMADPQTERAFKQEQQPYPANLTEPQDQRSPSLIEPTKPTAENNPGTPKEKQQEQNQKQEYLDKPPYQAKDMSDTDTSNNKDTALDTGKALPGKDPRKGPDKHSPIPATSRTPLRVGLSRKAKIAPLLKFVKK